MTEFIIIRHGQTILNKKRVLQGHMHGELDKTGIKQAQAVAKELSKRNFSMIYSSDLKRAVSTAEYIQTACNIELKTMPQLRERNLGIFEGLTLHEIKIKYPTEYKHYTSLNPNPDFIIPGGESINQMLTRLIDCLSSIAANHINEKIIIVTHSGPLDVLFRWVLNIPLDSPRKFKLFNTTINSFIIDNNNWVLKEWGKADHLSNIEAIDINV